MSEQQQHIHELQLITRRNEKKILKSYRVTEDHSCCKCEKTIKTFFGDYQNFIGCYIITNVPQNWYCGTLIFCQNCVAEYGKEHLATKHCV